MIPNIWHIWIGHQVLKLSNVHWILWGVDIDGDKNQIEKQKHHSCAPLAKKFLFIPNRKSVILLRIAKHLIVTKSKHRPPLEAASYASALYLPLASKTLKGRRLKGESPLCHKLWRRGARYFFQLCHNRRSFEIFAGWSWQSVFLSSSLSCTSSPPWSGRRMLDGGLISMRRGAVAHPSQIHMSWLFCETSWIFRDRDHHRNLLQLWVPRPAAHLGERGGGANLAVGHLRQVSTLVLSGLVACLVLFPGLPSQ